MLRRAGFTLLAVCAALSAVASCYSATEINLVLETDLPCATVERFGVAIYAAATNAEIAPSEPVAISHACTPGGSLGNVVFVPSGDRNARLALAVVVGVERRAEECGTSARGCVVARRTLRYLPNTSQRLPVAMRALCNNVDCGVDATCELGVCVSVDECGAAGCATGPVDGGPLPDAGPPLECESGRGDCDGVRDNGCETDLSASAEHCGACARSCGGEACTGGLCPTKTHLSLAMPAAIAVGGDDVYVTTDLPSGSLLTFEAAVTGASTTLRTGLVLADVLAVDGSRLYVSGNGALLEECQLPGCTGRRTLYSDYAGGVAVAGDWVYLTARINEYSGRVNRVTGAYENLFYGTGLVVAADTTSAFYTVQGSAGGVVRCPGPSCPSGVQVLVPIDVPFGPPLTGTAYGVALDATHVYWTELEGGRVMRAPRSLAGPAETIASEQVRPRGIAVDDDFVYWASTGTKSASDGYVRRARKTGGPALVLAEKQREPWNVALWNDRLFWTNRAQLGQVLSVKRR